MQNNDFHVYFDGVRILKTTFNQIEISYQIPADANLMAVVCPDTGKPTGCDWILYNHNSRLYRSEQPPYLNYNADDKRWSPRERAAGTDRQGAIDIHKLHFYNWRKLAETIPRKYL